MVLAYYDFARGADEIADSAALSEAEKLAQLGKLAEGLDEMRPAASLPQWAQAYMACVRAGQANPKHGQELLRAFKQDASQSRYDSIKDVLDYCRYSAVPVGRMVLDACGEKSANQEAADALCSLLQLLNHAQDMQKDYETLDRIYLPQHWMAECKAEERTLSAKRLSPELRAVYALWLNECARLLEISRPLAKSIKCKRLRLELRLIGQIAARLLRKLERNDPLAKRVKLSRIDYTVCVIRAMAGL